MTHNSCEVGTESMDEVAKQQELIRKAHEGRVKDRISVETLTFAFEPLTCVGLRLLVQERPDLKDLFLMGSKVTDEGFDAINGLKNLEELAIFGTELTEEGVVQVDPQLPLKELAIGPCTLPIRASGTSRSSGP
jgi:hypothetical protein